MACMINRSWGRFQVIESWFESMSHTLMKCHDEKQLLLLFSLVFKGDASIRDSQGLVIIRLDSMVL